MVSNFALAQDPALPADQNAARFLVHLLDYLAKDYGYAVQNGKIISQSEYDEQVEFSRTAAENFSKISSTVNDTTIAPDMTQLSALITTKASAEDVAKLARDLQARVITATKLDVAPTQTPNLVLANQMFQEQCARCHGPNGVGDGPDGTELDPKPSNFQDLAGMAELSPFQAFNTIRMGVPGTGMSPFATLADRNVWDLAFYVVAMRYLNDANVSDLSKNPALEAALDGISLADAASSSDKKLFSKLQGTDEEKSYIIGAMRRRTSQDGDGGNASTTIAKTHLNEARSIYKNAKEEKDFDYARSLATKAYLEGIEPIEPKLGAIDKDLLYKLEAAMSGVRSKMEKRAPFSEVDTATTLAVELISQTEKRLKDKPLSPWLTFLAAAAIVLREGFEAVLLIITLLGVIKAMGVARAARWVHGGWIAAVACGILTWLLSGWLINISGAGRELMEGITSLFAVVVLLLVGFWLHRQSEIGRWHKFLKEKVNSALAGNKLFGLAVIAFVAVFREAFETVLFLQAVGLEGGSSSKYAMFSGVIIAFIAVLILAWIVLRYSMRLPLRQLFGASSLIMATLAVILTGKGLRSLQETGMLTTSLTPINFRFELIGVYPSLETMLPQLIVLLLVVAFWFYGKKPSKAHDAR